MDNPDNRYLDFEAYELAKEPHTRQKAYYWSTAIGLQKVDGLSTSDYLKETAKRNIEGEISIDEAQKLITSYIIPRRTELLMMMKWKKLIWLQRISARFFQSLHSLSVLLV